MTAEGTPSVRGWWREKELLGLALIVFCAHFLWLDALSIRGEEPRRIAIAQDMLDTGDWIVPTIQGEPTFFRPPLQNWVLAVSLSLLGRAELWAVRLPGALAVLFTCVIIYGYGRQFMGRLGALGAGVAFATMAQVVELGHLAETESIFVLLVSAALLIWHWGYTRGWPDMVLWPTTYFIVGLGMLAKGTQAPIYFAATTGLYLIWHGQWRRLLSPAHFAGLATFAGVFGAWFIPYVNVMGWNAGKHIVLGETAARFLENNGLDLLLIHVVTYPFEVLSCMLPWSPLLAAFAFRELRSSIGVARPMVHYCVLAMLISFPTCWLVPTANGRYWMPLYPCVAVLVGLVVQRSGEAIWGSRLQRWHARVSAVNGWLMVVSSSLLCAGKTAGITWDVVSVHSHARLLLFAALGGCLGGWVLWQRSAKPATALLAAGLFVALLGSLLFQSFMIGNSIAIEEPVAALRDKLPADAAIYSFGQANHRFAFYLGKPIQRVSYPSQGDELPDGAYFCYELPRVATEEKFVEAMEHPERALPSPLPFEWKKVAVLWLDRYPWQRESLLLIGRRLNAKTTYD